MKFTLHTNYKEILKYSWSIKWNIASGIFAGLEIIVPLFVDSMPRALFAVVSFVCVCCSTWFRLLAQPKHGL